MDSTLERLMEGDVPQQLFCDITDTDLDECLIEELFFSMIARHPFHVLDETVNKNIYGEPAALADENAYTTLDPEIPIHIELDPEEEDLLKYGYDRQREAVFWFSSKIMRDRSISPKVGDRIDVAYKNPLGLTVLEQFIINEISFEDFQRQTLVPTMLGAAGNRTQKAKKP